MSIILPDLNHSFICLVPDLVSGFRFRIPFPDSVSGFRFRILDSVFRNLAFPYALKNLSICRIQELFFEK